MAGEVIETSCIISLKSTAYGGWIFGVDTASATIQQRIEVAEFAYITICSELELQRAATPSCIHINYSPSIRCM